MEMKAEERTRCEIYSRVMGYHRPISDWNTGKQAEFAERKCFNEPHSTKTRENNDQEILFAGELVPGAVGCCDAVVGIICDE